MSKENEIFVRDLQKTVEYLKGINVTKVRIVNDNDDVLMDFLDHSRKVVVGR